MQVLKFLGIQPSFNDQAWIWSYGFWKPYYMAHIIWAILYGQDNNWPHIIPWKTLSEIEFSFAKEKIMIIKLMNPDQSLRLFPHRIAERGTLWLNKLICDVYDMRKLSLTRNLRVANINSTRVFLKSRF